jgi:hypothetical protein
MRCVTSEPEPVLQRIGTSHAMIATTVIIFGRTRSPACGAGRLGRRVTRRTRKAAEWDERG